MTIAQTPAQGLFLAVRAVNTKMREAMVRAFLSGCSDADAVEWRRLVEADKKRRQRAVVPMDAKEPSAQCPAATEETSGTKSWEVETADRDTVPPSTPSPFPGPLSPPTPSPFIPQQPAAAGEGKDEKRKEPKPEQPADPRFAPVTAGYCAAYQTAFGEPYAHNGGRDGQALKKLLKSLGDTEYFTAERIVTTARKAMERRLLPYAKECKFVGNLHTFCQHYNDIRTELKTDGTHHKSPRPSGNGRNDNLNAGMSAQYSTGVIVDNN